MNSPATKARSPPAWTQCKSKIDPLSIARNFTLLVENIIRVPEGHGAYSPPSAEFIPAANDPKTHALYKVRLSIPTPCLYKRCGKQGGDLNEGFGDSVSVSAMRLRLAKSGLGGLQNLL